MPACDDGTCTPDDDDTCMPVMMMMINARMGEISVIGIFLWWFGSALIGWKPHFGFQVDRGLGIG